MPGSDLNPLCVNDQLSSRHQCLIRACTRRPAVIKIMKLFWTNFGFSTSTGPSEASTSIHRLPPPSLSFSFPPLPLLLLKLQSDMGRPKASNDVREFAVDVAQAATVVSKHCYDIIARSGHCSLFALLTRISPQER